MLNGNIFVIFNLKLTWMRCSMYILFSSNIHERQLSRMVMSISDTVFKVIEQYGSFHKPVVTFNGLILGF